MWVGEEEGVGGGGGGGGYIDRESLVMAVLNKIARVQALRVCWLGGVNQV